MLSATPDSGVYPIRAPFLRSTSQLSSSALIFDPGPSFWRCCSCSAFYREGRDLRFRDHYHLDVNSPDERENIFALSNSLNVLLVEISKSGRNVEEEEEELG